MQLNWEKFAGTFFSARLLPKFVTFHECAVKMKNVTKKSATEIQEHGNWVVLGDFALYFFFSMGEGAMVLPLLRFVSASS